MILDIAKIGALMMISTPDCRLPDPNDDLIRSLVRCDLVTRHLGNCKMNCLITELGIVLGIFVERTQNLFCVTHVFWVTIHIEQVTTVGDTDPKAVFDLL